ncbi:hypothetical protein A3F52_00805 [Candidatus Uhrbacteria bacterium RIFCSPHIGHO2_12_FULL_47_11]|nr:MAG: hypothetical protein A2753_02800 [Candidatus Uhrbacteria bacterium RIFCSPHIGHO2_01_FULL_47_11]OGL74585.1 MAG: hypothetical protein A3F52_00805 [Candidatus Uhrbacteria bacterium RIFCSPHIGHO2_12_FULL_47_11]
MGNDHLQEMQKNEVIRKRLAKLIVYHCFRNSAKFEDLHTRGTPLTDYEVKQIMIETVNRTYKFLTQLSTVAGDQIVEHLKKKDEVPHWNDPVEP